MSYENPRHRIQIDMKEPTRLEGAKFRRIGYRDEVDSENRLEGQVVEFRGERWTVSMVAQQVSLDQGLAGVKNHPEPDEAELIATVWGVQKVRVETGDGVRVDRMCSELTEEEARDADYVFVEKAGGDPELSITTKDNRCLNVPFSITMPGESHRAAYSREAGCIAIKLKKIVD